MNNTSSSSPALPLISVIVITYNRRIMLHDTIKSILSQTYKNFEIIIINDYGEDVWDIIQSFNSEKILYLSTIKNSGPAFARNTAHSIAKGEYICYLDDDDEFLPMHLETAVEALSENKVDVIYTNALYVDEVIVNNKRIIKREYTKQTFNIFSNENLLISNFIPINTLMYKAALLHEVKGFNEKLDFLEDWEFFIRLASIKSFLHINKITVKIRNRIFDKDNISDINNEKHYQVCKEIYQIHPAKNIEVLKGREKILYLTAKAEKGREISFLAFFKVPIKFRHLLSYAIYYYKSKLKI